VEYRRVKTSRTIDLIQAEEGYPVEVTAAVVGSFQMVRNYTGTVVGGMETEVVSAIGEYISKVLVHEGQAVTRDQVICELSHDNPSAGYMRARLNLDNAERELNRIQALYEQGAVPKQALDSAVLMRDMAGEALNSAEKLLYIRAPIAGIVTELTAEVGKMALPGESLARIVSKENVRVKVDVPARDRALIKNGQHVKLTNDDVQAQGTVKRIALSADPEGRNFTAWIELNGKPDGYGFSPGLIVDAAISVINTDSALVVPTDALDRVGSKWRIFIVKGSRARIHEVEIGGRSADEAWIRSGIEPGDQIVVSGANLLYDGAPVRIISRGVMSP